MMAAGDALLLTLAKMAHPTGSSSSVSFAALQAEARYIAANAEEGEQYELGDAADKIVNAWAKAAAGGSVAGEVLLQALSIAKYAPEHLSINKTMWLIYNKSQETWPTYEGKAIPKTKKSLMSFWTKYKTVSHLWASYRLALRGEDSPALAWMASDEGLVWFYGVARQLCDLADDHDLPLGNGTLKAMRTNLPSLSSPLSQTMVQVPIEPLTDWAHEKLAEYNVDDWRYMAS